MENTLHLGAQTHVEEAVWPHAGPRAIQCLAHLPPRFTHPETRTCLSWVLQGRPRSPRGETGVWTACRERIVSATVVAVLPEEADVAVTVPDFWDLAVRLEPAR